MPHTDSSDSDEAIVNRVVHGDTDAYAVIMERYEQKLHRYTTYLMRNPMAAHDAVQETFIKAYQNIRSFKPKYKFSSWIYRIAHNEALNAIKKGHYEVFDDVEVSNEPYDTNLPEVLDRAMLGAQVRACIHLLEPKYRDVVQLVYFEHMQYDEASDVLHIPASTVGVRLARAKAKLRALCTQKGIRR